MELTSASTIKVEECNWTWNDIEQETNVVPAEGDKTAKIVLIGEAPGKNEDLTGRPFVGAAGNLLEQLLHKNNLARHDCYITNLCKVRPSRWYARFGGTKKPKTDNDFQIFWKGTKPSVVLEHMKHLLLKELEKTTSRVIVCLGGNALWALTGKKEIGKWRGTVFEIEIGGIKRYVLGTFHPAAIYRPHKDLSPGAMATIINIDIGRATSLLKMNSLPKVDRTLIIEPTLDDILEFSKTVKSELSFDIETRPGEIICISFASSPTHAISIPTTKHYWGTTSKMKDALVAIEGLLTLDGVTKVAQNMMFDLSYICRFWGFLPTKPWYDTQVAMHSCYSELLKGLDFMCSIFTFEPYYKDDLKMWETAKLSNSVLYEYNAKDSAVTLEIKRRLDNEMDKLGVRHTFYYMMDLIEPLLFMSLSGLKIDINALDELKKKLEKELNDAMNNAKMVFGEVNFNSPKQLKELFYEKLGYDEVRKDGKLTTDDNALKKLSKKHPEVKLIQKVREKQKALSNYAKVNLDPIDGKLRCEFKVTGTETGRISSARSPFGSGTNLQNWPKGIRHIVIPDEDGLVFTEADLKGAEAMVVAYISEDEYLIKLFEEGKNIHTWTACMLFGVDEDEVKRDKDKWKDDPTKSMYYKAKKIRHAGNYMMSWKTVSDVLEVPAKEAKRLLNRFYDISPAVKRWHSTIIQQIKLTRTLTSLTGRKRIFFDMFGPKLWREAVAFIPQDTVTTVINKGIIRIYNTLCAEHKDIALKLQVHDSVLLQHPKSKTELVHEMLPKLLHEPLEFKGRKFAIEVELKTGKNWRDLEEV